MITTPSIQGLGTFDPLSRLLSPRKGETTAGESFAVPKPAEADPPVLPATPQAADPVAVSREARQQSGQVQSDPAASAEQLAQRLQEMVDTIQQRTTALKFVVEKQDGQVLVQVINQASGKTVRQIPPEEVLNLQARMRDMTGLLFKKIT